MDVDGLHRVLSPEGWPYASSTPVDANDPGRFHALFGRDALITSLQLMPVRPDVARASLRALASAQGKVSDELTGEEPGKIGHEFRDAPPSSFVAAGWPDTGAFRYYATADATQWFLVVLASLDDSALSSELEPCWRAAASWLERALDEGGGLVTHRPGSSAAGLTQQGWRDAVDPRDSSGGGILRRDGSAPDPPFADADTQAVTVAALRAVARLAHDETWDARAAGLRRRLTDQFLPDITMLEGGQAPVHGAGSQLGWLLWADAVDAEAVGDVADRLCVADILTPFGLRTLASTEPAYDPHAYHRGAVWPFDCWLGWGGLRAAGRHAEAEKVRTGVLDAVQRLGGYPELYAVDDGDSAQPVQPVRLANHVQAWTVGAVWAFRNDWSGRPVD